MTNRSTDALLKDCYSSAESRLNQQIKCISKSNEGCPVIDETGTVCGETDSLSIFKEFRKIYEDCLKKLEASPDGSTLLKKLSPFTKIVDDLWEQNTMLVEAVEELEQEATCQVTNLQNKLDKSCQKELHCILKAKERQVQNLNKELSEKNDLLAENRCRIEQLEEDLKTNKQYCKNFINRLKCAKSRKEIAKNDNEASDNDNCDDYDPVNLEKLINEYTSDWMRERNAFKAKVDINERQLQLMTSEKNKVMFERNDLVKKLQCVATENERLTKEKTREKMEDIAQKEELKKTVEKLIAEKTELLKKINDLQENIKEINCNFKETRWALTSEIAEKHDEIQELKRCIVKLEEQLRQADKQIQFKEDVVKDLRREIKYSKKSGRTDLYDVAEQLTRKIRSKHGETSTSTFTFCEEKHQNMSCASPCQDGPDSGFFSTATFSPERGQESRESEGLCLENAKLRSQIECLKNSLKMKMKDLRIQQEFTKDLEEELDRTKLDLIALQEKCERQERGQKSATITSLSDPGLSSGYGTLYCVVNKVEETLRNLSKKHSCGLSGCKSVIDEEMEKIRSVKNDLEVLEFNKSKPKLKSSINKSRSNQTSVFSKYKSEESISQVRESGCNLIHLSDVETFREKALTGVATLEEMREQIDILEGTIQKYLEEFPCECDKPTFKSCEERLETLRTEFDEVTDQLCSILLKFNGDHLNDRCNDSSVTCGDLEKPKDDRNIQANETFLKLKMDSQNLQQEICNQECEIARLKDLTRQLEKEFEEKQCELIRQDRELEFRISDIAELRDLMEDIGRKLKGDTCKTTSPKSSPPSQDRVNDLRNLLCAVREFGSILESTKESLVERSKPEEENDRLRQKIICMEKYICNREETLKVLQDTVKLKECQIEEIKLKMECSENEASKLTQDVEEKCRLIANLQEAVRKCKQFEINLRSTRIEALKFKNCDLNNKLRKSEKEIVVRDKKLESLQNQIVFLSSKNIGLHRELNSMEPKLKSMYKTCHMFEKVVNDLQTELNVRECEVDGLYGKIKELEEELDAEFKKCENRAMEDSKCIEDLSVAVKEFEQELCSARENYKLTISETEEKLLRERAMFDKKESEYQDKICQLKFEITKLTDQLETNGRMNDQSAKINDLESIVKEAESRQLSFNKKIIELENILQYTVLEHEEERKNILQKLCEEKSENVKNKTLITKLNENLRRKIMTEKTLKECMERITEDAEVLRTENEELKSEVEVRKNIINTFDRNENMNLSELENTICRLKMQKVDIKSRCCALRAELDKELRLKRLLECRVEDLNSVLESKLQEFGEMVENYKCMSSKLQQIFGKIEMAESEKNVEVFQTLKQELDIGELNECECLKKIIDAKAMENAKLFSRLLITKVEMESMHTQYFTTQANQDCLISRLRFEANCLEKNYDDLQDQNKNLKEENKKFREEVKYMVEKTTSMQEEFREKQKEMCAKLRATLCEKNELLISIDKLQKRLEHICLENINKDEANRELIEECSRLKINNDASDNFSKSKSDKIICNLNKELKNLQCELCSLKESYNLLNEEYQNLLEQFKCLEKKKINLEKLYHQINGENGQLQESKLNMEKELCELKNQNLLLKEKIKASASNGNPEDVQALRKKIQELTVKIKTLEQRIIPDLEEEITEKNCCIEGMNAEIREANISSQRMRNEALRVIQHTKKYLAAQRCANETLKSRLECSNKRGILLGAENRELEEQLKAVTRMNEFLLCQLETTKSEVEAEPSCSPLPWGCGTVERDTSSSEYLGEPGDQKMQTSTTNAKCVEYDLQQETKRKNPLWNNIKQNKHGGFADYSSCRSNIR